MNFSTLVELVSSAVLANQDDVKKEREEESKGVRERERKKNRREI